VSDVTAVSSSSPATQAALFAPPLALPSRIGGPVTNVDGRSSSRSTAPSAAEPGELLIDAAERTGTYIPRFCYHPRMQPVGMCRMCVVEVDTGRGPALQPACMLEVTDGMVVDTESEVTKKAQDGVLEFLLINHPLDCPVCDKGGECPLQDQTMAYGPGESRFVEEKRHFEKPIPISDLVPGPRALHPLRPLHPLRQGRRRRPADPLHRPRQPDPGQHLPGPRVRLVLLAATPCRSARSGRSPHCPTASRPGRGTSSRSSPPAPRARSGAGWWSSPAATTVLRYQGVDIDPVNWGWLCDKGRFDFEAVNSEERLGEPLLRRGTTCSSPPAGPRPSPPPPRAARRLDGQRAPVMAVLGGAQLTNEDAYAWAKLAKGVIGTDNVDAQLGDGLPAEVVLGLPRATIDEACAPGGTVLLIGPDLKEELPVLHLRLRHAVQRDGVKVVELTSRRGATRAGRHSRAAPPGRGRQVVRRSCRPHEDAVAGADPDALAASRGAGRRWRVTVVLGRPNLAEHRRRPWPRSAAMLDAAARSASCRRCGAATCTAPSTWASPPASCPAGSPSTPVTGSPTGAGPRCPPSPASTPPGSSPPRPTARLDVLVLLGADPLSDFPDRDLATRALAGARTVIALDRFLTAVQHADVVLPVAGFAEVDGTTTNLEGRISTLDQKVTPPGTARSDWMIAAELAHRLGADLGLGPVEAIWDEIERLAPSHAASPTPCCGPTPRSEGVVAPLGTDEGTTSPTAEPDAGVDPDAAAAAVAAEAADEPEEQAIEQMAAKEAQADAVAEAAERATTPREERRSTAVWPSPTTTPGPRCWCSTRRPPGRSRPSTPTRCAWWPPASSTTSAWRSSTARRWPCLAQEAEVRLHPHDFDRLGISAGARVSLTSARGAITLAARRSPAWPGARLPSCSTSPARRRDRPDRRRRAVTEVRVERA
jgi:NADH-quinone oxidoreductase subunit G